MSNAAPLQTQAAKSRSMGNFSRAGLLLQRKCACGSPTASLTGECEECASKKRLQTKLTIGASNDPLELEADRVADQVMAVPAHSTVRGGAPKIQRCTAQPHEEAGTAPASVDRALADPGRPLEPLLRQDMEQRFGHDFSRVRVHFGDEAEQSARDVDANAYTVGHDVVFGAGKFVPGTNDGQRLVAHELTHVVQQSGSDGIRVSPSGEKGGLSPIAKCAFFERHAFALDDQPQKHSRANASAHDVQHHLGAKNDAPFGSSIVQRDVNVQVPQDAGPPRASAPIGKKYLILYDASDVEVKAQAEQTAKDHGTAAHAFDPTKLGDLTKQEQPDVIMTFGHGEPGAISMGTGLRIFRGQKTISSELEKAGQTKSIHFVAQACSAGAEKGLMDNLHSDPSLKNYTFVSHATGGHVTRNENIRVAGGAALPDFLAGRFQIELGFDKQIAEQMVKQVFVRASVAESASYAPINTVLREISVLGFERFWELVKVEHSDVASDPAVLELNMTKEARERFAAGIAEFRSRMLKAVEEQMKLRLKSHTAAGRNSTGTELPPLQ